MEDEVSLWTLENPMTTLKMGSLNALIATNMGTWQKMLIEEERMRNQEMFQI